MKSYFPCSQICQSKYQRQQHNPQDHFPLNGREQKRYGTIVGPIAGGGGERWKKEASQCTRMVGEGLSAGPSSHQSRQFDSESGWSPSPLKSRGSQSQTRDHFIHSFQVSQKFIQAFTEKKSPTIYFTTKKPFTLHKSLNHQACGSVL